MPANPLIGWQQDSQRFARCLTVRQIVQSGNKTAIVASYSADFCAFRKA